MSAIYPSGAIEAPIRYRPEFEVPEDNEAQVSQDLTQTMLGIQDTTFKDSGKPIRSVHAKSHGVVEGEFEVLGGLPAHLAQGLFAHPGRYKVVMRFSTTPGDILDDSVTTPRGAAIKVIGVEGARVPGSEGDKTQDFVLVDGPAFHSLDGRSFLRSLKLLAATTDTPQALKKIASSVLRGAEAFVEAFGSKSPKLNALGGHPQTHVLSHTFFSQVPILYGDYFAKVSLGPVSPELVALADAPFSLHGDPDGLRKAVSEFFAAQGGEWELRVQLSTDAEAMPIEDPRVEWPQERSPYLAVARIRVPPQDSWSAEKQTMIDEGFSFSPWHALAAHRPLGRIMRERKQAYEESARLRRERAGKAVAEPQAGT